MQPDNCDFAVLWIQATANKTPAQIEVTISQMNKDMFTTMPHYDALLYGNLHYIVSVGSGANIVPDSRAMELTNISFDMLLHADNSMINSALSEFCFSHGVDFATVLGMPPGYTPHASYGARLLVLLVVCCREENAMVADYLTKCRVVDINNNFAMAILQSSNTETLRVPGEKVIKRAKTSYIPSTDSLSLATFYSTLANAERVISRIGHDRAAMVDVVMSAGNDASILGRLRESGITEEQIEEYRRQGMALRTPRVMPDQFVRVETPKQRRTRLFVEYVKLVPIRVFGRLLCGRSDVPETTKRYIRTVAGISDEGDLIANFPGMPGRINEFYRATNPAAEHEWPQALAGFLNPGH